MAINGDFASALGKYADKIEHATDVIELRRLQRESSVRLSGRRIEAVATGEN